MMSDDNAAGSSWLPKTNYSLFTLEDLENPRLVAAYSIYWDVTLVVTTTMFIFMLHMIITKSSQEMSGYKWYLIHQLTWSYLFDLYVGLWKVVPLWPFYIGYSAGIFANSQNNIVKIQLMIPGILSVGMGFSIYVSVVHRYVQASPFSIFYKYYSVTSVRAGVYIFIFIAIQCVICIPLLFALPQQHDLNHALTTKFPVLAPVFKAHPSMFGYEATDDLIKYIIVIVAILITLSISIFFLYLNFIRILRKNKQHLSVGTYNMQLMLLKALFIQIAIFGLLLVLPITLAYTLTLFGFKQMPIISLIAIAILGTHAFVEFCVLSYFIRSYRDYIKGCFKKVQKMLGFKVKESVTVSTLPSSVSDLPSRYR